MPWKAATQQLQPGWWRSTALLVQRLSNNEIANKLYISPKTVKTHAYNIYQKLNVSTCREAAAKASTLGILRE